MLRCLIQKTFFRFILPCFAVFVVAGCTAEQPKITIENARAELSPAIANEGAVYLTIRNDGGTDAIKSVRTSIPGAMAMLHIMTDNHMASTDMMRISSHRVLEFKPGEAHLMLEKMPAEAKAGYQFTVTLVFEKSGEKVLTLQFANAAAPMSMKHSDGKGMTTKD